MLFNAAPLEQRIFGIDAPVDNRVIEIIRNAEYKVGRYFRNVLPELTNINYVIERLPTYYEESIERTKNGYRRYIKPVRKVLGSYANRAAGRVKTIVIDLIVFYSDHILRTGGQLSDGTRVYGIGDIGDPEGVVGHELIHGYRDVLGTHPDRDIEEGITQYATEQIFPDDGGAYPLETEAVRRVIEEQGAGNVFYPGRISSSKMRGIINSFRRHCTTLSRRIGRLFW